MPAANQPSSRQHRRLAGKLVIGVLLSFAFGYALVPLYDVFCEATGLNGKTIGLGGIAVDADEVISRVDRDRIVTVEFTGTAMPGLAWEIQPLQARLDLHPGELQHASYRIHNRSDRPIIGQAVPSVSPGVAALQFQKLECFCFSQQPLAPGETKDLAVSFIVKPELDQDVRTITLSYSFFNISGAVSAADDAPPR